jgi:low affinity Fe/Cu permease
MKKMTGAGFIWGVFLFFFGSFWKLHGMVMVMVVVMVCIVLLAGPDILYYNVFSGRRSAERARGLVLEQSMVA